MGLAFRVMTRTGKKAKASFPRAAFLIKTVLSEEIDTRVVASSRNLASVTEAAWSSMVCTNSRLFARYDVSCQYF